MQCSKLLNSSSMLAMLNIIHGCCPSLMSGCSSIQHVCFALRTVLHALQVAGRERASAAGVAEVDCQLHVVMLEYPINP